MMATVASADVTADAGSSKMWLEIAIAPWPIACNISSYLPAGDLITLARTNTTLRALLHGFGNPEPLTDLQHVESDDHPAVRDSLNIGFHDTLYWARLKDLAPFECASKTHTKGSKPRPCRFCSRPICEACIVRDSMARGKEKTFSNRCRYLCPKCWDDGNVSKTRRFPLVSSRQHSTWFGLQGSTRDDVCCCTFKEHGFLCLECKDRQNAEASSDFVLQCHGEGCRNPAGKSYERRRICTWCDKTLPRHLGGSARLEWNEKIIEARRRAALSRQADMEEYNRKRLKLSRMSRRELRGDKAVQGDPEADVPQYVRHLDTFNYRSFMSDSAAPTGNEVYLSKKGHWTYSTEFLKHIGRYCRRLPSRPELSSVTRQAAFAFARSNTERRLERRKYYDMRKNTPLKVGGRLEYARLDQWHNLKAPILDLLVVQCVPFEQAQFSIFRDYDFMASEAEYQYMLTQWGHDWRNVRFAVRVDSEPKWEGDVQDEPAYNDSCEDSDLQLARRLQDQMDRDAAEAMQFEFFDKDDRARIRPNPVRGFGETIVQYRDRDVPLEDTRQYEEDEAGPASDRAATQSSETARADDTTTAPLVPESDDNTLATNRAAVPSPRPKDDPPPYDWASPLLELARRVTWDEVAKQVREQMRLADPSLGRDADELDDPNEQNDTDDGGGKEKGKSKETDAFPETFLTFDFGDSGDEDEIEDDNEDNNDNDDDAADENEHDNSNGEEDDEHENVKDDDNVYHDAATTHEQFDTRSGQVDAGNRCGHESEDEDEVLFEGRRGIAVPKYGL